MCGGVKMWFMNLSMKRKLILLCVSLIALSTFLSSCVVYLYTADRIRASSRAYVSEVMEQSAGYLNEQLKNVLSMMNQLQTEDDFIQAMKSLLYEPKQSYAVESTVISNRLSQYRATEELISSLYVHTDRCAFYNYSSVLRDGASFPSTELYRQLQGQSQYIYWGVAMQDELFRGESEVVPMVIPVRIMGVDTNGQFIVVYLKAEALRQRLAGIASNVGGWLYIINDAGEIVLTDSTDPQRKEQITRALAGGGQSDYQISHAVLPLNGWRIGCVQETRVLLQDVRTVRNLMVLIALLCAVLFSLAAALVANSIASPLRKLQRIMEQSEKNSFSLNFNVRYRDEVGQLGQVFNVMCARIRSLVSRVEQEQEQKRSAELRALNAQINPHFLYNTLDCVYWTSMKNGDRMVADMALDISSLFRLGLNQGRELTTLGNEIQHVTSYLHIQKTIYKEKFTYTISCDPILYPCPIIKILLQPLAENSILHAFQDRETGGQLCITVARRGSVLSLQVADNGRGVEEEQLTRILSGQGDGYALCNIQQRLRLHYPGAASLAFRREAGWFIAEITLPWREGESSCTV